MNRPKRSGDPKPLRTFQWLVWVMFIAMTMAVLPPGWRSETNAANHNSIGTIATHQALVDEFEQLVFSIEQDDGQLIPVSFLAKWDQGMRITVAIEKRNALSEEVVRVAGVMERIS